MIRRPPAAGMSLIELMVVMAIGAMILGAAMAMLLRAVSLQTTAIDHYAGTVALARLGQELRGDAHAARTITATAEGEAARLTFELLSGRRAEYEIVPAGIRRVVSGGSKPMLNDLYVLRGTQALKLRAEDDGRSASVVLARVEPVPGHEAVIGSPFEITAVIPARRDPAPPSP